MRKLRILLPSIALIVVMCFSVTIGVFAATSSTLTITSTVSFNSPGIKDLVVECYVKQGNSEKGDPWFIYSTDNTVESDGTLWDLKNHNSGNNESISFATRDANGEYAPVTLIFNIKHKSDLPLFAFFTASSGDENISSRVVSQQLNGVRQPDKKLVDATFTDNIYLGIPGREEDDENYEGGEVSIELELEPNSTMLADTVNFNYNLVITKTKMFTNQTVNPTNNNIALSNPNSIKEFIVTGNSIQSQETPSPSNPQEIVSFGDKTKNLFDGQTDLSFSGNGTPRIDNIPQSSPSTYNKYYGCAFAFNVTSGKTYTISGNLNASADGKFVLAYRNDRYTSGAVENWNVTFPITVTVPEDKNWIVIAYWSNSDNNVVSWSNIQCEEGTKTTEYEPYGKYKIPIIINKEDDDGQPYSETVNIYLDEPLRKVGEYADYIDIKNKKVVRNVGSIIYNGSEGWGAYDSGNGYLKSNTIIQDEKPVLCNLFKNSQSLIKTLAVRKNYGHIYVYGVVDDYPTAEEWRAFLAQNNMEVIGPLATFTEETIDIPNINIDGATSITIGTQTEASNITLDYWQYN